MIAGYIEKKKKSDGKNVLQKKHEQKKKLKTKRI